MTYDGGLWPDDDTAEPLRPLVIDPAAAGALDVHPARARFDFGDPNLVDTSDDRPSLFARSDGTHLFYTGAVNLLAGEPSACKSWIAQALCRDLLEAGHAVIYLDHEDTYRAVKRRMVTLGVTPDALAGFYYPRTIGTLSRKDLELLAEFTILADAPLIVIDGVAEALSAAGLKEDNAADYARWHDAVPRTLARATGAGVLLLDHVPKPPSSNDRARRGLEADLYPRGSGHKIAALDGAAYMVTAVEPLSRQQVGIVDLIIGKDRGGYIGPKRAPAARVTITPHDDGRRITTRVDMPPRAEDRPDDGLGPATPDLSAGFLNDVYDAVDAAVRRDRTPVSTNAVRDELRARAVRFRDSMVSPALIALMTAGRLERHPGPRKSRTWAPPARQGTLGAS